MIMCQFFTMGRILVRDTLFHSATNTTPFWVVYDCDSHPIMRGIPKSILMWICFLGPGCHRSCVAQTARLCSTIYESRCWSPPQRPVLFRWRHRLFKTSPLSPFVSSWGGLMKYQPLDCIAISRSYNKWGQFLTSCSSQLFQCSPCLSCLATLHCCWQCAYILHTATLSMWGLGIVGRDRSCAELTCHLWRS